MSQLASSDYLYWAKTRKTGRINLAASGVLPCPLTELNARIEDLEINGPSFYGYEPLQQAIANHCRVSAECVIAASGTSLANFIAMAALISPGDEVLIEQPVYEPLLSAAQYFVAVIKRFSRSEAVPHFLSNRTRLIVVTNLHNPSCELLREKELRELGELAQSVGARVLVDEVYLQCLYEKASSAFHYGKQFVTTSSLTKAYGLGGLRCGWILADPELAQRMWKIKDLMDPSATHPAELLSVIAFRKLDSLAARAKQYVDKNRTVLIEFLRACKELELSVPEYGTCVFPKVVRGDGDRLFEILHDRYDTDVVPGRFFEVPQHFRMGIGGESAAFVEGLARLREALREI
jgi:aspartate/methionine/tyrosine aminotransferase